MKLSIKPLLLLFAFGNLIIGMLSGLGRMGWQVLLPESYVHHGAIMVGGFLGSLIAVEKVIPLKQKIYYVGPLLSASSIIAFIAGEFHLAVGMLLIAAIVLMLVYASYLKKQQHNVYLVLSMAGSFCWFIGNMLLLWKRFYPSVFPWWIGFLLFTIVSERLELSKFLPVTRQNKNTLFLSLGLFLLGIILPFHEVGTYLSGISLAFVSIWLLRHDVIRINIRKEGLARFVAFALLCGYIALLIDGIFLIILPDFGFAYDIIVHTFFLGFVFSMILAHGPIILPGVLGLTVKPYHHLFYLPLTTLLLSVTMRILADVILLPLQYRLVSGWLSMGSITLYFILMLTVTVSTIRHEKAS